MNPSETEVGFRLQGAGFRVQGAGFRIQGSEMSFRAVVAGES